MKKGITVEQKNSKIYLKGGIFPVREYTSGGYNIGNNFLSWENASYMYSEPNEEEADDYLLNHALQENKKLCVCFSTPDPGRIEKHFANFEEYEIFVQKTNHIQNDNVFVYRKGCLADYFDMEYVEDIFYSNGISAGLLACLENVEISDFVTGKYKMDGVSYNLLMDTGNPSNDAVLQTFKEVALIISGLIFGYPIEIIITAIRRIFPYQL